MVYLALLLVQISFGLNFYYSKLIMESMPPLTWAWIRVSVTALVMVGAALAMKRKFPGWKRAFWIPLFIFSWLGVIFNQGFFLMGLHLTTASNSAILTTTIPVFTALLAGVFRFERLTPLRGFGIAVAFGGALLIRKVEQFSLSDQTFIGDLFTVGNAVSYALFLTFSKRWISRYDPFWTTALMFCFGTVVFGSFAWTHPYPVEVSGWSGEIWFAMAFTIGMATVAAYFLNVWALARVPSTHVAIFVYLQPVIASVAAWLGRGEVITLRAVISAGMIFLGVVLTVLGARAK